MIAVGFRITLAVVVALAGTASSRSADDKPLPPHKARDFVGKEVTVEATIEAVGQFSQGGKVKHIFLVNAASPNTFKPDTLYVVIPVEAAKNFGQEDIDKLEKEIGAKYGTTIRVRGKVALQKEDFGEKTQVRIEVTDPKQITVVKK